MELCIKSDAKANRIILIKMMMMMRKTDSEVNRDGADAESPFRCFSLFLPHLRTITQEKRLPDCLRFGTGGPSLC